MALHIDDDDGAKDYFLYKDDPTPFSDAGLATSIFPLTMSGWCKPDAINDHDAIMSIGNSSGTAPVASLNLKADGYATAESKSGVVTAISATGSQYTAGDWQHFCAVFSSATSRLVYMDGVAGTENTNDVDLTGGDTNKLTIGEYASTWNREMNGHLADCALWNVALSAAEVLILAKGYTAIQVRPESLVSYYPLVSDYLDVMGENLLTFGTDASATAPTFSDHTRIIEDAPVTSRSAWGGI